MDRSSRHTKKINKDIVALNNTLDQMDLTDISRTFHPKEAKYTFNSKVHRAFSKTHYMVGHQTSLVKFKKIEILSNIFSDHTGLKLETNLMEKTEKHSNTWRLNNMLLNNEWVNNEIKKKSKCLEHMKMNTQQPKISGI